MSRRENPETALVRGVFPLSFTVPGPPVPKARARVVRRRGKITSFTPDRTKSYQDFAGMLALEARQRHGRWALDRRYSVLVVVQRSAARGDVDNFGKAALDACNGVLWADDRQVFELHVHVLEVAKGAEQLKVTVEAA